MDSTVPDIILDSKGYCNYCSDFKDKYLSKKSASKTLKKNVIQKVIKDIKYINTKKKYGCVIGLSGGVDSAWAMVRAIELGLNPLVIHLDNGWNSELAQNNISNLVSHFNVDLITYVINWEEYRALMQSFFDADVIDIELLYDNAIQAILYKFADKYNLKHILAGTNSSTEGMKMPSTWNWFKLDALNIRSIAKKSGLKLKTMPIIGVIKWIYFEYIKRIRWVSFLDLEDYRKEESLKILKEKYGFKPYPYKHYESIFTRFYQGYILPRKFNVDKRRLHLSNLVATFQIEREEALQDLIKDPFPNNQILNEDIDYFLKKMNWSSHELEEYLNRPEILHSFYPSEKRLFFFIKNKVKPIISNISKRFSKNIYAVNTN